MIDSEILDVVYLCDKKRECNHNCIFGEDNECSHTHDENNAKNSMMPRIIHQFNQLGDLIDEHFEIKYGPDGKIILIEREVNDNQRDETVHNSQVWNDEVEGESLSDATETSGSSIQIVHRTGN